MSSFVFNVEDLDHELLNQDLPEKNKHSQEDWRNLINTQQSPMTYKKNYDSDSLCYGGKDTNMRQNNISVKILAIVICVFTTCLVFGAFLSAIKGLIEQNIIIDNINNNSAVSIFTPDTIFYVESYTFDNNVFVGFIRKRFSK